MRVVKALVPVAAAVLTLSTTAQACINLSRAVNTGDPCSKPVYGCYACSENNKNIVSMPLEPQVLLFLNIVDTM